eukprot:Gb_10594 [translate_table: standard]
MRQSRKREEEREASNPWTRKIYKVHPIGANGHWVSGIGGSQGGTPPWGSLTPPKHKSSELNGFHTRRSGPAWWQSGFHNLSGGSASGRAGFAIVEVESPWQGRKQWRRGLCHKIREMLNAHSGSFTSEGSPRPPQYMRDGDNNEKEEQMIGPPRPQILQNQENDFEMVDPLKHRRDNETNNNYDVGKTDLLRVLISNEIVLKEHTKVVSTLAIHHTRTRVLTSSYVYFVHMYDFQGMISQLRSFRQLKTFGGKEEIQVGDDVGACGSKRKLFKLREWGPGDSLPSKKRRGLVSVFAMSPTLERWDGDDKPLRNEEKNHHMLKEIGYVNNGNAMNDSTDSTHLKNRVIRRKETLESRSKEQCAEFLVVKVTFGSRVPLPLSTM